MFPAGASAACAAGRTPCQASPSAPAAEHFRQWSIALLNIRFQQPPEHIVVKLRQARRDFPAPLPVQRASQLNDRISFTGPVNRARPIANGDLLQIIPGRRVPPGYRLGKTDSPIQLDPPKGPCSLDKRHARCSTSCVPKTLIVGCGAIFTGVRCHVPPRELLRSPASRNTYSAGTCVSTSLSLCD